MKKFLSKVGNTAKYFGILCYWLHVGKLVLQYLHL